MTVTVEHQPRARIALNAALAGTPSHAYLFRGPKGAGKRAAARAFAAEILAGACRGPRGCSPSCPARPLAAPRPRLARPARRPASGRGGARAGDPRRRLPALRRRQARLRRRGGRGAARREPERPAEDPGGAPRVRPPDPAQLRARGLLETIASRCQPVDFAPLSAETGAGSRSSQSGGSAAPEEIAAAARSPPATSSGRGCCSRRGGALREEAWRGGAAAIARRMLGGEGPCRAAAPWKALLDRAGSRRGRRSGGPRGARGGSQVRSQAHRP